MYNIDHDFIFHWNNKNIIQMTNTIIEKSINNNNIIGNYKIENAKDVKNIISLLSDDITICQSLHSICNFMQYVSIDNKKNSIKAEMLLSNHEKSLNMRTDIYNKLLEIKQFKNITLSTEDEQFINELIVCYKKNGIELSMKNKDLLQKLNVEILNIETIIEKHICDSENNTLSIEYDKLKGMPLHIINTLENIDIDNVKIKLDKTNYNLCVTYMQDSKVRNNIELLYSKNKYEPIIGQIAKLIVLRDKHDKLLSFNNHCECILSNQMCKNSEQVQTFLKKILNKLNSLDHKTQNKNILDIEYNLNKWKQDNGIYDDIIKEYFEIKDVISKIINIYELIFNVKFIKLNNVNTWSNDMLIFCIMNNDNNIGYLYLDLFNKECKTKQMRCFCLQSGCMYPLLSEKYIKPIIALCTSFNKFTNGKTLLNFNEVASIFHEFGHVMHHIFGKTKYIIFSGTNVEEDFVETPAQILELLCYEPFIIKYLSNHYCKKTMMSDVLIGKIIQLKNLEDNLNYKKNILLSYYDQIIYSSSNFVKLCESSLLENNINHIEPAFKLLYNKLCEEMLNNKTSLPKEFMEIILGSDSKYYNILWSKMLAIDLYNANIKGKKIDGSIGNHIVESIFKYGGMKTGYEMCALYLGQDLVITPNNNFSSEHFEQYDTNKCISNKHIHDTDITECNDSTYIDSVSNNFCEIIDD